jgi:hypothetical protein
MQLDTQSHDTRGARSGHSRRMNDAAAQLRVLRAMGVTVSLQELQSLPPGGWLRFVPGRAPAEVAIPAE